MARKNVNVRDLVLKANNYFAADYGTRDGRKMLQEFVESVLHDTDNYRGFNYLNEYSVPRGQLPGVIFGQDGNTFPDDSRIYFIPPKE